MRHHYASDHVLARQYTAAKNMVERVLILGDGHGEVSIKDLPSETKSADDNLNSVASVQLQQCHFEKQEKLKGNI